MLTRHLLIKARLYDLIRALYSVAPDARLLIPPNISHSTSHAQYRLKGVNPRYRLGVNGEGTEGAAGL